MLSGEDNVISQARKQKIYPPFPESRIVKDKPRRIFPSRYYPIRNSNVYLALNIIWWLLKTILVLKKFVGHATKKCPQSPEPHICES